MEEARSKTSGGGVVPRTVREAVVRGAAQQAEHGEQKRSVYEHHLRDLLGSLRLDQIDVGTIQMLKARMNERGNRYGHRAEPA